MIINTPVSLGELVDKISILHIKNKNIKENEKLLLVKEELSLLQQTLNDHVNSDQIKPCLLYTSPSPRDKRQSRMPSSA